MYDKSGCGGYGDDERGRGGAMCRWKDGVEDGDDEDDNEEIWTADGVSGDDGWVGRVVVGAGVR